MANYFVISYISPAEVFPLQDYTETDVYQLCLDLKRRLNVMDMGPAAMAFFGKPLRRALVFDGQGNILYEVLEEQEFDKRYPDVTLGA